MRIGLLTEGGYPYVSGDARLWCDRLVRGLGQHDFHIYALSRSERQEDEGWIPLPPQVGRVRTAPLWTADDDGVGYGRRARRRFAECYGELAAAVCAGDGSGDDRAGVADRFGAALYGLAELARDEGGGLVGSLRSETAVRVLEGACRAPGALRAARDARVPDLLAVAAQLERTLRPLSLDWYEEEDGLGSVDLCHATSGGAAALTGLLARHFSGVPLLVTEYGVQLRAHYLGARGSHDVRGRHDVRGPHDARSSHGARGSQGAHGSREASPSARALLAAFHGRLAAEVYRQAALITPGNTHARRWQERCGADRAKLRTVYPGMDASRFSEVGERAECADPDTLVWVGRIEPAKDLISLLHAFAAIREERPKARLRIVGAPAEGPEGATYLAQCEALAAQLFPDEAEDVRAAVANPVSFAEIGGPEAPSLAEAYGAGAVVVLSSVVEGFPISLVEAMFCGRATVSTDVGAVVEIIGGTGLVVPSRNPRALAEACVALLRDPERRERLGAAARARALELFTVEQNITAFHSIYMEIISRCPVRRVVVGETGEPLPFAVPAEAYVPGRWAERGTRLTSADGALKRAADGAPRWAAGPPVRGVAADTGTEPMPAGEGAR
ncbi:DUF3492 domain-containing protein [Streptomyces montanus]|uniref:D-inositol 3-phosphate glycosyltransferase n=1 Tax=Streptomyces montanus TaxID=2580423 RepID=A0A5R9F803_9ACTN|nr:DUF3492 domain-containing protein [Streptomyces montanus]TLS39902.1 DUF3492 domain-containing protein [Streptomyces montanus]